MKWNKVNVLNKQTYESQNNFYIAETQNLIENIFQSEKILENTYLNCSLKTSDRNYQLPSTNLEVLNDQFDTESSLTKKIFNGSYERLVSESVLYGKYNTYVLCGAMGSGKSSTKNFIANEIRKDFDSKIEFLFLDFNEGYTSKNDQELLKEVTKEYFFKIKTILFENENLKKQTALFVDFLFKSDKLPQEYSSFINLRRRLRKNGVKYNTFTVNDKIDLLDEHVETVSNKDRVKIKLYMRLLNYINKRIFKEYSRIVLILDNIDRLPPSCQYNILEDMLCYNKISKVKTLIALRRSTFIKFNSRAALSFGYIHHLGPGPVNVILNRINFALRNKLYGNVTNSQYSNSIEQRLKISKNELEDSESIFRKVFSSISGNSVRLGLSLFPRVFFTNLISFQEAPKGRDLVRSLLCYENNMSLDDGYIANVFCEPSTNKFSLLQLRILQALFNLEKNKTPENERTVVRIRQKLKNLYDGLNISFSDEKYRKTLNYLLLDRRPLIGCSYMPFFESVEDLTKRDDVLRLTEIGKHYYEEVIFSISYLQESFESILWPEETTAKEINDSVTERFKFLRMCLREVLSTDLEEIGYYEDNEHFNKSHDNSISLIAPKIIAQSASSFINIASSIINNSDNPNMSEIFSPEIELWKSLLIEAQNSDLDNNIEIKKSLLKYERISTN